MSRPSKKRLIIAVTAGAFAAGACGAVAYTRLFKTASAGNSDPREVVAARFEHLAQGMAAQPAQPESPCPGEFRNEVVPTIELDDVQGVPSQWQFLSDENTMTFRSTRDLQAAQALSAAKHIVVFAASESSKTLPTAQQAGRFQGSMLLVRFDTGAVLCGHPLVVEAPQESFRQAFRAEALAVAQGLGVRIGLPQCRPGAR